MSSAMYAKQVSIRLSIAHHTAYVNLNPVNSANLGNSIKETPHISVRVFSLFKMFAADSIN